MGRAVAGSRISDRVTGPQTWGVTVREGAPGTRGRGLWADEGAVRSPAVGGLGVPGGAGESKGRRE